MNQDEPLPTYPASSPCERDKKTMENDLVHIHAPYNFVTLNDWVYCPNPENWGNKASHDIPFKDGLSGTIEYTLTAHSPLLVGGKQKTGNKDVYGEVCFAESPDNKYIIPGSSIRGMLRSVVEIASFGRMRMVDDARHGLRDLAPAIKELYLKKLKGLKYGILCRNDRGELVIYECQKGDLEHIDLKNEISKNDAGRRCVQEFEKSDIENKVLRKTDNEKPLFFKNMSVKEKYGRWSKVSNAIKINKFWFNCTIESGKWSDFEGDCIGFPVFTTQISDSRAEKGKHKDFVFYKKSKESIKVRNKDWNAFLLVHDSDVKGSEKEKLPWPGFWSDHFANGGEVPVFYLDDGVDDDGEHKLRIGLAQLPKLAWDYSIKQMIGHTHEDHNQDPENGYGYDMADLLFGTLGDKPEKHLKGRVNCGMLKAKDHPIPKETEPTILNTPKPTYYPNYLQQPAIDGHLQKGKSYNTGLVGGGNSSKPKIRGFKRYPARMEDKIGTQPLTREQERGSKATQVVLYPLPEETQFKGQISFHNLRPVELGALFWAMTWGNNKELRHGLGMGKPFGYGQVELSITDSHARKNIAPSNQESIDIDRYLTEYTQHMQNEYREAGNSEKWFDSPQTQNLLAMADPRRSNNIENTSCFDLRHMCLTMQGGNEFLIAKQSELVLRDYPSATKPFDSPKTPVLKDIFDEIKKEEEGDNNCDPNKIWGQKPLARKWRKISDVMEKQEALEEIRQYWIKQGWWNSGVRTKKKIQDIYERG